jgi:hypothetical protein
VPAPAVPSRGARLRLPRLSSRSPVRAMAVRVPVEASTPGAEPGAGSRRAAHR